SHGPLCRGRASRASRTIRRSRRGERIAVPGNCAGQTVCARAAARLAGLLAIRKLSRVDGLFAEDAVVRRVDGEAVLLLGGGRALLMQLAHPLVAQGVAEH